MHLHSVQYFYRTDHLRLLSQFQRGHFQIIYRDCQIWTLWKTSYNSRLMLWELGPRWVKGVASNASSHPPLWQVIQTIWWLLCILTQPCRGKNCGNTLCRWKWCISKKTGERGQDCRRDPIPMMTDNALANFEIFWVSRGGDTGKRGAEHRSFLQLWFTLNM